MNNQTILKTKENLLNSGEELLVASNHLLNVLNKWNLQLLDASYLFEDDKSIVSTQFTELHNNLNKLIKDTSELNLKSNNINLDEVNVEYIEELIQKRKKLFSVLRIYLSQFASLITALNWQSPSIKSSKNTRIGIEKSAIEADWNDYKRDRSSDTFFCEDLLKDNLFLSTGTGVTPVLNIFNSGMGAFASIIYFLICEEIVTNKVIAYAQNYVENRMLLKKFFKDSLATFDYNDTQSIINNILKTKPNAVFLEPLSNTNNLRLIDVVEIIREVAEVYSDEIYFILDVTCIVGFENLFDNYEIPKNIKIILHGSILKSPQLGLERVNAGFVQTFGLGDLSDKILDYRTLSGTNIQDFATNLLPLTTKELLRNRMKSIEDNARDLAEYTSIIDADGEIFSEIVYPGIKSHKDFETSVKLGFAGTFFNIKFIEGLNNDKYFELYVSEIIKTAKKYNCDLVHGASFGFNQTSIYYSVGWDEPENHYIRISTGIETKYEIETIKIVLREALEEFKKKYKTL